MERKIILILLILLLIYTARNNKENFSSDCKISVLILNYNRVHNLHKSIPLYLNYKYIEEIIVLNGHKDYIFNYDHEKVKCINDIDNNNKIYTLRRFKNYNLCKYDNILIVDDDIVPSKELFENMVLQYNKKKNNFYGPFSRICNNKKYKDFEGNDFKNMFIITGMIITSKDIIKNVWNKMLKNKLLFDLVVKQKGNCEDLFFNYEFKKLYNKTPIYVKGEVINLDIENGFSNTNEDKHYDIRIKFCKLLSTL